MKTFTLDELKQGINERHEGAKEALLIELLNLPGVVIQQLKAEAEGFDLPIGTYVQALLIGRHLGDQVLKELFEKFKAGHSVNLSLSKSIELIPCLDVK